MRRLPANEKKKVVVVGGGISGLSAAYYLSSMSGAATLDLELAEKSNRFGGKIETKVRDGFVIEKGPDSFLARKPALLNLSRELNLEQQLTGTNPKAGKTYILHQGRFHEMPKGLVMGIPTRIGPFISTGLLSPAGKMRAAFDLFLPAKKDGEDETLGAFLRRRLGREVQENIVEPLLSGIYAGDPSELSLRATFPQFWQIEQKHRSLILGMAKGASSRTSSGPHPEVPPHVRGSVFVNYRGGLRTVVETLEHRLREMGVRLTLNKGLRSIQRANDRYELMWEDGSLSDADAIILALPAFEYGRIFPDIPSVQAFASMPYVSVANVVLAYHKSDVQLKNDSSGFLVPRKEKRAITACTLTSIKWLHTAPKDKVLIRCYIGRAGEEQWMEQDDDELVQTATRELEQLLGIQARPLFYEVTRLARSMPQYTRGHLERVRQMREDLKQSMPGVFVTGSAFTGIGLPDCVRQGKEAAEQVAEHLGLK